MRDMSLIAALKNGKASGVMARFWHTCVPPLIVSKQVWDLRVYFDLRDNIDDFTRSKAELESREPDMQHVLKNVEGSVWDVGCNIGFFSFPAARQGRRVVAFDISEKAIGLLRKTATRNGLEIECVARGLTPAPVTYASPSTAVKGNKVHSSSDVRSVKSLTHTDAAAEFGMPALIKMDIEGGESAFFSSGEFRSWVVENGVVWMVELHGGVPRESAWTGVPHRLLGNDHVAVYHRAEEKLEAICPA